VVHGRHQAGGSRTSIARDFDITVKQVQRAVDYFEKRVCLLGCASEEQFAALRKVTGLAFEWLG
jgi:uncharacterized protein (DUF433 family)